MIRKLLYLCLGLIVPAIPLQGLAQDTARTSREQELEHRIERLEKRLKELEDRLGEAAPPAPAVAQLEERLTGIEEDLKKYREPLTFRPYWKEGLSFETNNGAFEIKIGGRIQNDWAFISEDRDLRFFLGDFEDGAEFRRARLYISGTVYDRLEFKAQYDFADGDADFKDAYLGLKKIPYVGGIRVGQFKEPFSLEELTSSNYITFMERGLPNVFAPARSTGVMLRNHFLEERLTFAVGVFRNSNDFGQGDGEGEFNVTTRLTGLPWFEEEGRKLLHLGFGYSRRSPEDDMVRFSERPEAHLAPRFVDTGMISAKEIDLFGGELAFVYGPFSLQGEFIYADVESDGPPDDFRDRNPDFYGYYVMASYFLTGEHRPYKTSSGYFDMVRPKRNFNFWGENEERGWGAWEVAVRYSSLSLSDDSVTGGELDDITLGLNWYLNPNTRMMLNYVYADLDADGPWVPSVGAAHILQMRFQLFF